MLTDGRLGILEELIHDEQWAGQQVALQSFAEFGTAQTGTASYQVLDDCGGTSTPWYVADHGGGVFYVGYMWSAAPSASTLCTIRVEASNGGLVGSFAVAAWIYQSPCADDPFENDNTLAMATHHQPMQQTTSMARIPNEDWILVAPDLIAYATMEATSSNAAVWLEIRCGTSAADGNGNVSLRCVGQ